MNKNNYRKIIGILMVMCLIMMCPPFYNLANKPVLLLGIPVFILWNLFFGTVLTCLLVVLFKLDDKYENYENKEDKKI
ncbi:hypothetical protein [Acetohalobium arabaticum]|uniref:DUF3311 domain-containing protein n=1 Tax=Acetohalobium arabaticum (strain ATCC 49924 / DSM 5501 / Z-7288) TaxID=574087 RepID=D9QPN0_ACEAZ|nr:hypothetical protein [Acetohalobium arabaticum]ADL12471.1 hypothetical protein Acear_0941 [Acetohalobium arabaticum DSM 5501]